MAFRIARNVTIDEPATHAFTINVTQSKSPHGVGPLGVHFDAITGSDFDGNTDPAKTLSFWWDFGDDGAVFTNSGKAGEVFGTDANIAQGPWVAHVYPENNTGSDITYTGYVYVYDHMSGKSGIQSFTVTVVDSDTFFADTNTIVVSQAGDFTGAPAGAQQITDVTTFLDRGNVTDNKRLLLRAGETFDINMSLATPPGKSVRDMGFLKVGRYGEGENPTFNFLAETKPTVKTFLTPRGSSGSLSISDINLVGDYDPVTGTGWGAVVEPIYPIAGTSYVTIDNCYISGVYDCVDSVDTAYVYVNNSEFTNWSNFGIWTSFGKLSVMGSSIKQNPSAVSGSDGKQFDAFPIWADHGPIRSRFSDQQYISRNDLFSCTGWSSSGKAHQSCIRYNSTGEVGHSGNINLNYMEGGFVPLSIGSSSSDSISMLGECLVDTNAVIVTSNAQYAAGFAYGNSLFRNNYLFRGEFATSNGGISPFKGFIDIHDQDVNDPDNISATSYIVGNTMVSLQSDSEAVNMTVIDNQIGLAISESQNLVYAPSVPNSADFTDYSPLDAENYYAPISSSEAYEGGTKTQYLWDTFDGELRDAPNNNIGAMSSELVSVLPTVNAGADQSVEAGATVTLDGSGSSDSDGTIASYAWTQTAGDTVTLSDATAISPTFTAPTTNTAQTLTFQLTVTDDGGLTSTDSVDVQVNAQVIESTLNATLTGIPDGTYKTRVIDTDSDTFLFMGDKAWASEEATFTLTNVAAGTNVEYYAHDDTNAGLDVGVTE